MKAAVLTEINKPLGNPRSELDAPKAGEARVRMKASGVMSDWHMMNGDWPAKLLLVRATRRPESSRRSAPALVPSSASATTLFPSPRTAAIAATVIPPVRAVQRPCGARFS